ncbi:MAG TPA: trypsin-like peptidase domain-containing protein [Vicinamibacterales bacterium]|jgi:S1-C subfamily serine protease
MGKDSKVGVWAIAGLAVLVGVIGTTAWNQLRPATPAASAEPPRTVAVAAKPAPPVAPARPAEPAAAPDASIDVKKAMEPETVAPREPLDDTPTLEDVVSRVSPAVVLVENGNARGTAFFVAPDTLLTNVHVIRGATSVTIRRNDGSTTTARVDRQAADYDVAVLQISNPQPAQPTIRLISALNARPGGEVIAIGSALGMLQNTVTRGIVSAVRKSGNALLIQTDAAINPGNSGGPLLDRKGNAIGITTMGFTERQGLSFAVAIDHAQALLAGRSPTATPSAGSTATDFEVLSPAQMSDHDQERVEGQKQFETAMMQLARAADSLDDYWRQFRSSCYSGGVSGAYDREWLATLNPHGLQGPVATGCEGAFDRVKQEAMAIRNGVIAADERARRADVFPGVRRQLREKYRFSSGLE